MSFIRAENLAKVSDLRTSRLFRTQEDITVNVNTGGTDPLPGIIFVDQAGFDSHGDFLTVQGVIDALPPVRAHRVLLQASAERLPAPSTYRAGIERTIVVSGLFIERGQIVIQGDQTYTEILGAQAVQSQNSSQTDYTLTVSGTPFSGQTIGGYQAEVTYDDASVDVTPIYDFTDSTISVTRPPGSRTATSVRVVRPSTIISEFDASGTLPAGSRGLFASEAIEGNYINLLSADPVQEARVLFQDVELDYDAARFSFNALPPINGLWHFGTASLGLSRCLLDLERLGSGNTPFARLYSEGVFFMADVGIHCTIATSVSNPISQDTAFRYPVKINWQRCVWHSVSQVASSQSISVDYAQVLGCFFTDCGNPGATQGGLTLEVDTEVDGSRFFVGRGSLSPTLDTTFIRQSGDCLRLVGMRGGLIFIALQIVDGGNGGNGTAALTFVGCEGIVSSFFPIAVNGSYDGTAIRCETGTIGNQRLAMNFPNNIENNLGGAQAGEFQFGSEPIRTFQSIRDAGGLLSSVFFDLVQVNS